MLYIQRVAVGVGYVGQLLAGLAEGGEHHHCHRLTLCHMDAAAH